MKQSRFTIIFFTFFASSIFAQLQDDCSSFLVSKGASKDGSVMITYTCDGEFLATLKQIPAADHQPGEVIEFRGRDGKIKNTIPQLPHTYAVIGLMNEYQVAIGETTFGGLSELRNPDGLLHYYKLMNLALKRAKTAREAIKVMTDLVADYGYASTGESFSIADKNEAWIMEMIGKGPGEKGALWVARRVPDGYICAHSNMARIGTFPLNDPKNCLYARDIIDFAVKKGYYKKNSKIPFSFRNTYDPPKPSSLRYCAGRVWSMFRRCAPSLNLSPDFFRGVKGAERYPLWIKPDHKISLHDVMNVMRDHYEGTDYDMTRGVDAGTFGCPTRLRGLDWKVDSKNYGWERSISTQQTAFSFISQSRDWLPDAVGGVYWYGLDDTYTCCYIPFYSCTNKLPESYTKGSIRKFSWNSAWWVFNFVANYVNLRYEDMVVDVQKVQTAFENQFIAMQSAIEKTALTLYKTDPALARDYLTSYAIGNGEIVINGWIKLGEHLITKYNDGYVKDKNGRISTKGYSEDWLRTVLKLRPRQFTFPDWGHTKDSGRLH